MVREQYCENCKTTRLIPPCIGVQLAHIDHIDEEKDASKNNSKEQRNVTRNDEWFDSNIWNKKSSFMEIKQVQAYNIENLIGNGGGSVGLFLGYSLIQLPNW